MTKTLWIFAAVGTRPDGEIGMSYGCTNAPATKAEAIAYAAAQFAGRWTGYTMFFCDANPATFTVASLEPNAGS